MNRSHPHIATITGVMNMVQSAPSPQTIEHDNKNLSAPCYSEFGFTRQACAGAIFLFRSKHTHAAIYSFMHPSNNIAMYIRSCYMHVLSPRNFIYAVSHVLSAS